MTTPIRRRRHVFRTSRKHAILKLFVLASLRKGHAAADSVRRATDAYDWIRSEGRARMWGVEHQSTVVRFVIAGLEAGGEQGKIVAAKAIEAYRLVFQYVYEGEGAGEALHRALGDDAMPPADDDDLDVDESPAA
jgi:hypothetical protein